MSSLQVQLGRVRRRLVHDDVRVAATDGFRPQRRREVRDSPVRRGHEVQRVRRARAAIAKAKAPVLPRSHRIEWTRAVRADAMEHHHLAADGDRLTALRGARDAPLRGERAALRVKSAGQDREQQQRAAGSAAASAQRLNLPKSSGRRRSRYSLSCSAFSSASLRALSTSNVSLGLLDLDVAQQRVRRENRRRESQRDRDAVRRPRVDLHDLAAARDVQLRVVRVLLHARDVHLLQRAAEAHDEALAEIVGRADARA